VKSRVTGAAPPGQAPSFSVPTSQYFPVTLATAAKNSVSEKPKWASTMIDSRMVPPISSAALMIWTHVVASIPPKIT